MKRVAMMMMMTVSPSLPCSFSDQTVNNCQNNENKSWTIAKYCFSLGQKNRESLFTFKQFNAYFISRVFFQSWKKKSVLI